MDNELAIYGGPISIQDDPGDIFKWPIITEEDEEHIQNIEIFLEQILPNEKVREYVLRLFSSFLTGKTGDEKIHFWTGLERL